MAQRIDNIAGEGTGGYDQSAVHQMETAVYGEDVRSSIANAIYSIFLSTREDNTSAHNSMTQAQDFRNQARTYATNASNSAAAAAQSEIQLEGMVALARSWVDGTDAEEINEDAINHNAYYFSEVSKDYANRAANFASDCEAHEESIVSGVADWGPSGNKRSGNVEPADGDYDSSMIWRYGTGTLGPLGQPGTSIEESMVEYETALDQLSNSMTNMSIDVPVIKCYGVSGRIGSTGLQSICIVGNYIYTYSYDENDDTGRFYRFKKDGTEKILYKMQATKAVNKGNGMCSDGTYLYLIGPGETSNTPLRSITKIPISSLNADDTPRQEGDTVYLNNQINGIDYKETKSDGVHLYGYQQDGNNQKLIFYDINVSTGDMTLICECSFPEAKKFDQDMAFIDGHFYCVSDYHGALVKISENGNLRKIIRLSEYCDNGVYTGEFEGIADLGGGRILLGSAYTGYKIDEQSDVTDMRIDNTITAGGVTYTIKQPRTIVFSCIDLACNISPYSREMRGSLGHQDISRHINYSSDVNSGGKSESDVWLPDGTAAHPYSNFNIAFLAKHNPRHNYTFVFDTKYDDGTHPIIPIINQDDIRVHIKASYQTSASDPVGVYIYRSNITLSSECDFKIIALIDSQVDYVAASTDDINRCKGVYNHTKGNSKFNCQFGSMGSPFGNVGSTPRGFYVLKRSWGTDSDQASDINTSSVTFAATGRPFVFRIRFTNNKGLFFGSAVARTSGGFRVVLVNSRAEFAEAYFTLSGSGNDKLLTISSVRLPGSSETDQTKIKFAEVEMGI